MMRRVGIAFVVTAVGCSSPASRDRAEVHVVPTVAAALARTSVASSPTTTAVALRPQLDGLSVQITEIAKVIDPTVVVHRVGDASLYIGQRSGQVIRFSEGNANTILDIADRVTAGGEQGLLGLAFNPSGNRLYVHYSDSEGDTSIDEFTVDTDGTVAVESRRHVFGQEQPHANHNGGTITFGPDGYLYVGLGDGGSSGDPQRRSGILTSLLGKILRIDPGQQATAPYAAPSSNPFVGIADARPEIWATGLRNPWRLSFDRATGDLWIGDVGQGATEEIDRLAPNESGVDFGWSAFEGSTRFNADVESPQHRPPVHEYQHGDGPMQGCSITGGFVYRGTAIPALRGAYVFADYCAKGIRAIDPAAPDTAVLISETGSSLATFGEDTDGEMYVASLDGQVFKITS